MKISLPSLCCGVLLLLSTALAAAPPPADFLASLSGNDGSKPADLLFTPAGSPTDTCNPPIYSCESCPSLAAPVKLCSKTICGNFVIFHCDPCAPTCTLPPS
jgi:hypothetical protein